MHYWCLSALQGFGRTHTHTHRGECVFLWVVLEELKCPAVPTSNLGPHRAPLMEVCVQNFGSKERSGLILGFPTPVPGVALAARAYGSASFWNWVGKLDVHIGFYGNQLARGFVFGPLICLCPCNAVLICQRPLHRQRVNDGEHLLMIVICMPPCN